MPFMETWRRTCIFRGYEELCLRHLSFKVPKGQSTGGDTEHTVGRKEKVRSFRERLWLKIKIYESSVCNWNLKPVRPPKTVWSRKRC